MRMVFIWRVVNGRLAEGREVDDSMEFLRQQGQSLTLASYDTRMTDAAKAMQFPIFAL